MAASAAIAAGPDADGDVAAPGLAVEALYARHFDRLAALAASWLGDRDAAEDVAQEALVRAYTALRAGAALHRPDAWLTRVARNLAVSELRRRSRLAGPTDRPGPIAAAAGEAATAALGPADRVEVRERLDAALAALLTLRPRYRDDLLLGLRADGPAAAAARGLTLAAWRARLARAREALRLALATPARD